MSDIIIRRLHETHDAHKLDTSIETINVGIFQKINSMCDFNLLLLVYFTLRFMIDICRNFDLENTKTVLLQTFLPSID